MNDPMLPLLGLSLVAGKNVVVKFDGGRLSSDGGILTLREIEGRLRIAERMAACIEDPRACNHVTHSMADIIRFRLLMIAAGYEDGARNWIMDVGDWLRSLGLGQYETLFRWNDIDAEVLSELTEGDLEKFGVSFGHRKRLLRAIASLGSTETAVKPAAPVALQTSTD